MTGWTRPREWQYVMLHHSLTQDSGTVSWGAIRNHHTETKRWSDIGYHAGIELVGEDYEVLLGRSWARPGAHCREAGMNRRALGVCLVGDFDAHPPPEVQWRVAVDFVATVTGYFQIPTARILGHRDHTSHKTCPGTAFDLAAFRAEVDAVR